MLLVSPAMAFAQSNDGPPPLDYSGFVNCDGVVNATEKGRQNECHFADLMALVIKLINWAFYMSIPLVTALIAYAGVLYMTGQKGKIDTAKKIFSSVAIGFIIVCTAWVIMRTLVGWFVKDPDATTFIK